MIKSFILCLSLALVSACATVPASVSTYAPITADSTTNLKRLYDADAVYGVAATSYLILVNKGLLTGTAKTNTRVYLLEAASHLKAARPSFSNPNPSILDNVDLALALIAKANVLMHK